MRNKEEDHDITNKYSERGKTGQKDPLHQHAQEDDGVRGGKGDDNDKNVQDQHK